MKNRKRTAWIIGATILFGIIGLVFGNWKTLWIRYNVGVIEAYDEYLYVDPPEVTRAVDRLAEMGPDVFPYLEPLRSETATSKHHGFVIGILRANGHEGIRFMIRNLKDQPMFFRLYAVTRLGGYSNRKPQPLPEGLERDVQETLVSLLNDEDRLVKNRTATALLNRGPIEGLEGVDIDQLQTIIQTSSNSMPE